MNVPARTAAECVAVHVDVYPDQAETSLRTKATPCARPSADRTGVIAADDKRKISIPQMPIDPIGQLPANALDGLYRIAWAKTIESNRFVPLDSVAGLFKVGEKPQCPQHRRSVLARRIACAVAASNTDDNRSTCVHFAEHPWQDNVEE